MNNKALDFFFSLGDKVTKGDAQRKADFDYYMLWVMFGAFILVLVSDLVGFIKTMDFSKLGWSVVIFCVCWFQYYGLKNAREGRKLMKSMPKTNKEKDDKIDDFKSMMKGFDNSQIDAQDGVGTLSNPLPVERRSETDKSLQFGRSGSEVIDNEHPVEKPLKLEGEEAKPTASKVNFYGKFEGVPTIFSLSSKIIERRNDAT
jgi:hypothetical protein